MGVTQDPERNFSKTPPKVYGAGRGAICEDHRQEESFAGRGSGSISNILKRNRPQSNIVHLFNK